MSEFNVERTIGTPGNVIVSIHVGVPDATSTDVTVHKDVRYREEEGELIFLYLPSRISFGYHVYGHRDVEEIRRYRDALDEALRHAEILEANSLLARPPARTMRASECRIGTSPEPQNRLSNGAQAHRYRKAPAS